MSSDKNKQELPFSALSFKEQQEKWMAWRSSHLEFEKAEMEAPTFKKEEKDTCIQETNQNAPQKPSETVGQMVQDMPFKAYNQELLRVYKKHEQALKKATAFKEVEEG